MWVMGGSHRSSDTDENDVWYSTDGVNWTEATASAAWSARNDHVVLAYDDKMWVMGGHKYDGSAYYNDVWYSEDGIDWYEPTAAPKYATYQYDESESMSVPSVSSDMTFPVRKSCR